MTNKLPVVGKRYKFKLKADQFLKKCKKIQLEIYKLGRKEYFFLKIGKKYRHKKTGLIVQFVINQHYAPITIYLQDNYGNEINYHLHTFEREFEELSKVDIINLYK
jgi:hypothetical protein